MANETISFPAFRQRFAKSLPKGLSKKQRDDVLTLAWEECAFIATLTDERGAKALNDAIDKIQPRKR